MASPVPLDASRVVYIEQGVTGLIRRLAMDKCLPGFLLSVNKFRGTNHWIIFMFLGEECARS
jgi:hypothetical protein